MAVAIAFTCALSLKRQAFCLWLYELLIYFSGFRALSSMQPRPGSAACGEIEGVSEANCNRTDGKVGIYKTKNIRAKANRRLHRRYSGRRWAGLRKAVAVEAFVTACGVEKHDIQVLPHCERRKRHRDSYDLQKSSLVHPNQQRSQTAGITGRLPTSSDGNSVHFLSLEQVPCQHRGLRCFALSCVAETSQQDRSTECFLPRQGRPKLEESQKLVSKRLVGAQCNEQKRQSRFAFSNRRCSSQNCGRFSRQDLGRM